MGPDFGTGDVLYFMYISSFKPKPTQDVRDRQTDRQTDKRSAMWTMPLTGQSPVNRIMAFRFRNAQIQSVVQFT